jgi:hypothetical protein
MSNGIVYTLTLTAETARMLSEIPAYHEERRAESEHEEAREIDVAPIHHVERARLGNNLVEDVHAVMSMNVGMLPCRSSSVCILTAPLGRAEGP